MLITEKPEIETKVESDFITKKLFSRLGWETGSYSNFQIKVYREYGNYEEEYLNVAYLDFNEAKVRGLEPDTFYKFELAGLIVLPDGDFTIGPHVTITARTVGKSQYS